MKWQSTASNFLFTYCKIANLPLTMGIKQICRCADVAMGKRRKKSADAKCGCVGKRQMCG